MGLVPGGSPQGVRVLLEGTDFAAVEAAAAELKARFGPRFAVTARRRCGGGTPILRLTGALLVRPGDETDASEGQG